MSLPSPLLAPSGVGPEVSQDAFVHARGGQLVVAGGGPLLLRGVGLGNWLLPEGYMWGFGDDAASPRQIEALVAELLGETAALEFWRQFRQEYVTSRDVAAIAAAGFDHVRLPINWRIVMTADGELIPEGLSLIDRLIEWCRDESLFVLLDLHGAPGGQTGTNIDDSQGLPELFMSERNLELTEKLWVALARRYRDEPAVLGYDLLNEPLPNEWQHRYPAELVALYRRLTAAIRAVDPHHLIMYEGTHWATNWDIFTEVWDSNSALQFHRYWMAPQRSEISRYLEVGRELGLPIYMGEGGENAPEWIAATHQLYEDHGIGWNLWPWKKIETATSPVSIVAPEGWAQVLAFAAGTGPRPRPADARRIFAQLIENLAIERCELRPEIVAAALRRAPVTLPAYAFTFRGAGVSYGTSGAESNPALRPDDAVTLRRRDGSSELAFHYPAVADPGLQIVAELGDGDWLAFEIDVPLGRWRVVVTLDPAQGHPAVSLDGVELRGSVEPTDGGSVWTGELMSARAGRKELRVRAADGPIVLVGVAAEAAP